MKIINYIRVFLIGVFITSYTIGVFQSSLPFVKDFLEHTFNEFDHIQTIHFEDGKYHVHSEVEEIQKQKSDNNSQNQEIQSLKKQDVHSQNTYTFIFEKEFLNIVKRDQQFCFSKTIILKELEAPDPPPKLLV